MNSFWTLIYTRELKLQTFGFTRSTEQFTADQTAARVEQLVTDILTTRERLISHLQSRVKTSSHDGIYAFGRGIGLVNFVVRWLVVKT